VDLSSGADLAVIGGTLVGIAGAILTLIALRRRGRETPKLTTDPPTIDYGRRRGYRLRVTNAGREPINDAVAQLIGPGDEACSDPEYGQYIGYLDPGAAFEFVLHAKDEFAMRTLRVKYTFRDTATKEHEYVSRAQLPPLRH
jgi:hypothetical protein